MKGIRRSDKNKVCELAVKGPTSGHGSSTAAFHAIWALGSILSGPYSLKVQALDPQVYP